MSDHPIAQNLVRLLGLGPGLTPSGDDLVAGTLVALHALGFARAAADLWRVVQPSLKDTNAISSAHLRAAAHGQAAAVLHEAVAATAAGRADAIHAHSRGWRSMGTLPDRTVSLASLSH